MTNDERIVVSFLLGALILGTALKAYKVNTAAAEFNAQLRLEDEPCGAEELRPQKRININAAGLTELVYLPGIGPKLAERIMEYRQANGAFSDIGGLMKVKGIGEKKFAGIKQRISVE